MTKGSTTPERAWIEWLGESRDPRGALKAFCPQYFYFSYHQVVAFPGLFRRIDPLDRTSLAMLADVLHEELGRDDPSRVHSKLFERFATAAGVDPAALKIPDAEVVPGVRLYVEELDRAFQEGTRAEALATYVFLESSAVETYGPLLDRLLQLGFIAEDVEFFALHAEVEVEHAAAANDMLARYGLTVDSVEVAHQLARLADLWRSFWLDIDRISRAAVAE